MRLPISMANALSALIARLRDGRPFSRSQGASVEGAPASHAQPESQPVPTKLIIGLGNPGPKYESTRHNVGFRIVERMAARGESEWAFDEGLNAALAQVCIADEAVALLAPQTFMNASGEALMAALARWPALDPEADVLIVFDDLDLPVGRIRLRPRGGAGGHNGLRDIQARLEDAAEARDAAAGESGRPNIPRLRFGIGHPGKSGTVIDWVLGPFSSAEEEGVLPEAVEAAAEAAEVFVTEGITAAMQTFNSSKGT